MHLYGWKDADMQDVSKIYTTQARLPDGTCRYLEAPAAGVSRGHARHRYPAEFVGRGRGCGVFWEIF